MKRLISVIIPVFNRPLELGRALGSLASQTVADFDVIVCDDGSTEDIRSVVSTFSGSLDLKYVRIQNSGGPARPRNLACEHAKGEWLSFLDSDDWWDQKRIEKVLAVIDCNCEVVYHSLRRYSRISNGEITNLSRYVGRGIIGNPLRDMICKGNPIAISGAVVQRKAYEKVGGFDEATSLASVEDFDLWLRLAEGGARFKYIADALGVYSIGVDSISTSAERSRKAHRALIEKHRELVPPCSRSLAASHFSYTLGTMALQEDDMIGARLCFENVEFHETPRRWLVGRMRYLKSLLMYRLANR